MYTKIFMYFDVQNSLYVNEDLYTPLLEKKYYFRFWIAVNFFFLYSIVFDVMVSILIFSSRVFSLEMWVNVLTVLSCANKVPINPIYIRLLGGPK